MCDSLWYLMCLSAKIRPTLESWDNAIKCQDPDAIFRNMPDIYVIILLHYYLQCSDALMLKGMQLPCSTEPSPPMFISGCPRSHQCLMVSGHG